MALHGEIKVNSFVIGFWEAVRGLPVEFDVDAADVDAPNSYSVTYWYRDQDNETFTGKGVVQHKYVDGAPTLVSIVMEFISFDVSEQRADRQ